jgi:hypothetical protein
VKFTNLISRTLKLIPVRLGIRGTTTAGPHHEGGSGDFGQPTQQHVFHGRLAAQSPLSYKSTICANALTILTSESMVRLLCKATNPVCLTKALGVLYMACVFPVMRSSKDTLHSFCVRPGGCY